MNIYCRQENRYKYYFMMIEFPTQIDFVWYFFTLSSFALYWILHRQWNSEGISVACEHKFNITGGLRWACAPIPRPKYDKRWHAMKNGLGD